MARVFLIVLDSFGIGQMPDAEKFGDVNVNTLRSCMTSPYFSMPHMKKLGLFAIDGVKEMLLEQIAKLEAEGSSGCEKESKKYRQYITSDDEMIGRVARMTEASMGKDTTIGHWEIAGIVSDKPLPTYPNGFPKELLDEFSKRTGRGVLCNLPYSGTEVIKVYGDEHVRTGDLIVYTSADSVFQIAAHEDVVPLETLYEYCRIARELLIGEHGVGRVIARPFIGENGNYTRTPHRHDYSILPPAETMLDKIKNAGKDVIAVGKIHDIFAGVGMTEFVYTSGNEEGIEKTLAYLEKDFEGLCFINLVDYDMLYGHRRDIDGYARALAYFDEKLPQMMDKMREDDILIITADHGCDPSYFKTTDHTREYTPCVMYGKKLVAGNEGTKDSFAEIADFVLAYLDV